MLLGIGFQTCVAIGFTLCKYMKNLDYLTQVHFQYISLFVLLIIVLGQMTSHTYTKKTQPRNNDEYKKTISYLSLL